MCLIKLKNINFFYKNSGAGSTFELIAEDFSVAKGEFVSILGPNGSGKSTLLKIISGALKPLGGEVVIDKKHLKDFKPRSLAKKIAFVPQSAVSIFPYSVQEIVAMGRTPYTNLLGYESREDLRIIDETMDLLGISHLKNKGINEISGGESQRTYIARALVQQPEIILLDEPNAHLDIKHQFGIFNLLRELNHKKELTVIAVSHDLNLAGYYSQRALLMKNGRIFLDEEIANVLTAGNIKNVFDVDSEILPYSESNGVKVILRP